MPIIIKKDSLNYVSYNTVSIGDPQAAFTGYKREKNPAFKGTGDLKGWTEYKLTLGTKGQTQITYRVSADGKSLYIPDNPRPKISEADMTEEQKALLKEIREKNPDDLKKIAAGLAAKTEHKFRKRQEELDNSPDLPLEEKSVRFYFDEKRDAILQPVKPVKNNEFVYRVGDRWADSDRSKDTAIRFRVVNGDIQIISQKNEKEIFDPAKKKTMEEQIKAHLKNAYDMRTEAIDNVKENKNIKGHNPYANNSTNDKMKEAYASQQQPAEKPQNGNSAAVAQVKGQSNLNMEAAARANQAQSQSQTKTQTQTQTQTVTKTQGGR